MGSIKNLYTVDQAEDGVDVPVGPVGMPATDSIRIRGVDSKVFVAANNDAMRRMFLKIKKIDKDLDTETKDELARKYRDEAKLEAKAALFISWTFDEEMTLDAVKELLLNHPSLGNEIDELAGDRPRFFEMRRKASEATSRDSSS